MPCERLTGCPYYGENTPIYNGTGTTYRKTYCEAGKTNCARYMVYAAVGPEFVPLDLYPTMTTRAEQIIAELTAKNGWSERWQPV